MAHTNLAIASLDPELQRLLARCRDHAVATRTEGTRRAYRGDWERFETWCGRFDLAARPARDETVAAYVVHLAEAGRKPSTIARSLVAISQAHKLSDLPSPTSSQLVRETVRGLRRHLGTAQRQVEPIDTTRLRAMLETLGSDNAGLRDRALLLVGFVGAFRRSELVAISREDLDERPDGIVVALRVSKTDQEKAGRQVALPRGSDRAMCPVRALRDWLDAAGIESGAVFRPVLR